MPLPRISRRHLLQGTAATALATTLPGRTAFAKDTRPTPPAPPR